MCIRDRYQPAWFVHGHVHLNYDAKLPRVCTRGNTTVINATERYVFEDVYKRQYQSSYQDRINEVLDRLLARENFAYSYTQDPLYRQYAQQYTQNAHNRCV